MSEGREVLVPARIDPRVIGRAARAGAGVVELSGLAFGTTWKVAVALDDAHGRATLPASPQVDAARRGVIEAHIARGVAALLAQLGEDMSAWNPRSALSRFNEGVRGWYALPDSLVEVLAVACEVAEATGGAFDPTVGALVELWGFGPRGRDVASRAGPQRAHAPLPAPSAALLASRRRVAGWRELRLDVAARRAWQPGGLVLDVSGIGKGYAVDRVAAWLAGEGWLDALVEIGGELRGEGAKPDGSPWWVSIDEGDRAGDTLVALHGLAAATSGDAVQAHRVGGSRVSHTIDPRSGLPVDEGVAAVTVLHADCTHADACATAIAVMGAEAGLAYADRHAIAVRVSTRPRRATAGGMERALRASRAWVAMAG